LERYLGEEVFRRGVRLYLDRHAFGSTETEDLWKALGEAAGLDIPAVMNSWVFQAGYPLLNARREGGELVLSQQRFSYLPGEGAEQPVRWQGPVQVRIETPAGLQVHRLLLAEPEQRLALPADVQAVLVNEGGHGFYRVRYDDGLLALLLDRLPELSAIERF